MKDIICTNCGCKKLLKTATPFGVHDQYAKFVENPTLKIYACLKCGHLEFFDTYAIDAYKQRTSNKSTIIEELRRLNKQYEAVNYPTAIAKIQEEIRHTEHKLTDLDITIRQQQKLQEKLSELKENLVRLRKEEYNLKEQIAKLDKKLREANIELSKDEVIEG